MSKRSVGRVFLATLLTVCLAAPVVEAAVHLMKIEQVIGGVNGDTTAQAFQLRMRSAGQTVLGSTRIRAWDATGANPVVIVNFTASVSNGLAGDRILAVTPSFVSYTSPPAVDDTTAVVTPMPASYLAAGSLTFEGDSGSPIYFRLSWGGAGYSGSNTGGFDNDADGNFGPPFPGPLPSSNLQALQFQGTAAAPSTNNAADFALTAGAAVFTNNARNNFTLVDPLGACCDDSTGVCTAGQTEVDCENAGNRYGGNGSTCGTINPPCLAPTGACCDDGTGICTEDQTQTACENAGNRYGGDDSTCGTINPACVTPTGACCDDATGDCTEAVTQTACESGGDRYGGNDSTCADIDPPCTEPAISIALETVVSGLASPIHVTHAGDGSGRLFIVDQVGLIRVVDAAGNLLPTPFLDVTAKLPTLGTFFDERGLLGLAFHPDYETNGRFFIRYSAPRMSTGTEPCDLSGFNPGCHKEVLAEYLVINPAIDNVADPGSELILFEVDKPQFNHNAAMVEFGPDGYLYFSLGDGGGANDGLADGDPPGSEPSHGPTGNGQNIDAALGKLLRIDVGGVRRAGPPYAIPPDNPFVGIAGLDEIYAYGFRNPFRFSFDDGPGGTNDLYLADVGQNLFEEVNIVDLGGNYGWVIREAFECFDPFNPTVPPASCATTGALGEPLLDPVSDYSHDDGGLAIVGGYVYRGSRYPGLVARYVYGDFSADFGPTGRLYYFDTSGPNAFLRRQFILAPDNAPFGLVLKGMGEDEDNEIYVAASVDLAPSGSSGVVFRVAAPPVTPSPEPGGAVKNRFITFVVPPPVDPGPGNETAIAVTLTSLHHPPAPPDAPNLTAFEGQVRYVNTFRDGLNNPVFDCPDSPAFASTFKCARLGCDPEYRDWAAEIGAAPLHVTGAAIVPSSIYDVFQLGAACAGIESTCAVASGEVTVLTGRWGDVVPPVLNAQDVAAVVDKVRDAFGALIKPRAMLQPVVPNPMIPVSAIDLAQSVDANRGLRYPFTIAACP